MGLLTLISIILLISILVWVVNGFATTELFVEIYPPNTIYVSGSYPYQYWNGPQCMWGYVSPTTRYDSYDIRDYLLN